MQNRRKNDIEDKLEKLQLPQIEMIAHKKHLKSVLLASSRLQTRETGGICPAALKNFIEVITLKKKALAIVIPSLLILLAVFSYCTIFSPPQGVAQPQGAAALTLQVNPAITFVLDHDYTIISLEGVNDDGQEILSLSNLQGKKLGDALEELTALMYDQGFLLPDSKVAMIVHAVNNLDPDEASDLSDYAQQAMTDILSQFDLQTQVECFVLSQELYTFLAELGLSPMDYVDLLRANLTEEEIREVIMSLENRNEDDESSFDDETFDTDESMSDYDESSLDDNESSLDDDKSFSDDDESKSDYDESSFDDSESSS